MINTNTVNLPSIIRQDKGIKMAAVTKDDHKSIEDLFQDLNQSILNITAAKKSSMVSHDGSLDLLSTSHHGMFGGSDDVYDRKLQATQRHEKIADQRALSQSADNSLILNCSNDKQNSRVNILGMLGLHRKQRQNEQAKELEQELPARLSR